MSLHLAKSGVVALAFGLLSLTGAQAATQNLIVNGGFEADGVETYSPNGWTLHEAGQLGGALVTDATASPASGYATVGAASGQFYALLDSFYPSAVVLTQAFQTAAVGKATLSFQLFVNDQSGSGASILSAGVLDPNLGSQHVRVDLLSGSADPYATDAASVLRSFDLSALANSVGTTPNGYQLMTFDVTSTLAAGGSFQLRFAGVGNAGALQIGVDNVALQVTAVPEPSALVLALAGIGLVSLVGRARRTQA